MQSGVDYVDAHQSDTSLTVGNDPSSSVAALANAVGAGSSDFYHQIYETDYVWAQTFTECQVQSFDYAGQEPVATPPQVSISGPTSVVISNGGPGDPTIQLTASGTPAGGSYTWSESSGNVTLQNTNSATVTVSGNSVGQDSITVTYSLNGQQGTAAQTVNVVASPTHFGETSRTVQPFGILHFTYSWLSTTGNQQDLASCQVGEIVTYQGQGPGNFVWPSPPYVQPNPLTIKPTVGTVPATDPGFGDTQDHPDFTGPYVQTTDVEAVQLMRWQCSNYNNGAWNTFITYPIQRFVNQEESGAWYYQVTKAGLTGLVDPLP